MSETHYKRDAFFEVVQTIFFWWGVGLLFTAMSCLTVVALMIIGVL
jgi:hypothetical protein